MSGNKKNTSDLKAPARLYGDEIARLYAVSVPGPLKDIEFRATPAKTPTPPKVKKIRP